MHLLLIIISCLSIGSVAYHLDTSSSNNEDWHLIKLAIISRHADRSPFTTFPNDPYPFTDKNEWPDGPDQLTLKGKKRMLSAGRWIRSRYSNFLSENPIEVYARSSPADRCINSVSLLLAGAYPPVGRFVVDEQLNWQPVPVHSGEEGKESMLNTPSRMPDCPAIRVAKQLQNNAQDVRAFELISTDVMSKLEKLSGKKISHLADVDRVYDSLSAAQNEGKLMPDWADSDLMNSIKRLDDKIFCVNSSTSFINRLEIGLFLTELKRIFITNTDPHKVFVYSTHDTRMASLLRVLKGFDGKKPNPGATDLFELRQSNSTNEQRIYTYHISDTYSNETIPLIPGGCVAPDHCALTSFFDGINDFIVDDEEHAKLCHSPPDTCQYTGCFSGDWDGIRDS